MGHVTEKMGTEQTYISKLEAGKKKLRVDTVVRIATALDTTASELMLNITIASED